MDIITTTTATDTYPAIRTNKTSCCTFYCFLFFLWWPIFFKLTQIAISGNYVNSQQYFPEKMAAVDIDVPVETEPQICNQEDLER